MKRDTIIDFCFVLLLVFCSMYSVCCILPAKTIAAGVLSVEQTACIIAQSELGANEPEIVSTLCAIPPGVISAVTDVLLAAKKGHAMALQIKAGK